MIRFDIDILKDIAQTLKSNKERSILTGFGVFWGVFILICLIGGGNGLQYILKEKFSGFAVNSGFIFSNRTSKSYNGFRKGRIWSLNQNDAKRLKEQVPGIEISTPVIMKWRKTALNGEYSFNTSLKGVSPEFKEVQTPELKYGRFINEMDVLQARKVCVIGKRVYTTLFPNEDENPCGKFIQIDNIYYQIIGVDFSSSEMSMGRRPADSITLPISIMQKIYNRGNKIDIICMIAKRGIKISSIEKYAREVIQREHFISPKDERAIPMFNAEMLYSIMDSLFIGVDFLIWLVGIGTILSGVIGVSNIMMVTVKERTNEIGIRRAIGATSSMIIFQIIIESIILTLIAGFIGLFLAILVLAGADSVSVKAGMSAANFQVPFWTAILSLVFLSVLGILAGLSPAYKAVKIKPVDAMRDE